jgi:hypothetical protein
MTSFPVLVKCGLIHTSVSSPRSSSIWQFARLLSNACVATKPRTHKKAPEHPSLYSQAFMQSLNNIQLSHSASSEID